MMKVCHDYELGLARKLLSTEARIAELERENAQIKALIENAGGDHGAAFDWAVLERISSMEEDCQIANTALEIHIGYWHEERSRAAELARVLRIVEWIRRSDMVPGYCPWCDNDKPDGHADDCPRQKVLGEQKGD